MQINPTTGDRIIAYVDILEEAKPTYSLSMLAHSLTMQAAAAHVPSPRVWYWPGQRDDRTLFHRDLAYEVNNLLNDVEKLADGSLYNTEEGRGLILDTMTKRLNAIAPPEITAKVEPGENGTVNADFRLVTLGGDRATPPDPLIKDLRFFQRDDDNIKWVESPKLSLSQAKEEFLQISIKERGWWWL